MGTVSSSSSSGAGSSSCLVSRYALGLFFILLVSLIWSAASILVQYLYDGMSFDSPFLLTYIGTSLFILLLPSRLLWERRTAASLCSRCCSCCGGDEHHPHNNIIIPWSHNNHRGGAGTSSSTAGYTQVHHEPTPSLQISNIPNMHHHHHHHPQHHYYQDHVHTTSNGGDGSSGGSVQLVPNHHDSNNSYCCTVHQQDDSMIHDPPTNSSTDPLILLSHEEHFRIALKIAPVWFIANWSYNASLAFTSISSSTVLASTSSLFTFLIAVICRDEDFSTLKLTGVVLGVCGSILTGWHDLKQHGDDDGSGGGGGGDFHNSTSPTPILRLLETLLSQDDSNNGNTNDEAKWLILGDFLSLVSAIGYAVQVILIRVLCPRDEQSMSMQLMLGYVGLINAIMFSPVAIHQVIYGTNTTTSQLTWTIFGCLVVKGLFDNVLSDYLWARAVVLTTATVATVGLGLTIPLAFLSDWMLGHAQVASVTSVLGALGILVGFILVNVGNDTDDDDVDSYPPHTNLAEDNDAYEREHHHESNHVQEEEEHVITTAPPSNEASIRAK